MGVFFVYLVVVFTVTNSSGWEGKPIRYIPHSTTTPHGMVASPVDRILLEKRRCSERTAVAVLSTQCEHVDQVPYRARLFCVPFPLTLLYLLTLRHTNEASALGGIKEERERERKVLRVIDA